MDCALHLGAYTIFRKSSPSHRGSNRKCRKTQYLVSVPVGWPYKWLHVRRWPIM